MIAFQKIKIQFKFSIGLLGISSLQMLSIGGMNFTFVMKQKQNIGNNQIMKKIQSLELSTKAITLTGFMQKGTVSMYNPNPQLAVSYQIMQISSSNNYDKLTNSSVILSIFPKDGILLKQQSQRIIFKIKDDAEWYHDDKPELKICVRYHFNNNYNRILSKNRRLPEGFELQHLVGEVWTEVVELKIDFSGVREEIENDLMFENSLNKCTKHISRISHSTEQNAHKQPPEFEQLNSIVNNLQINSRVESNNEEEEWASVNSVTHFSESKSKLRSGFPNCGKRKDFSGLKGNINSLQLLLLTLLSAFFFSLGSNLSAFMKN